MNRRLIRDQIRQKRAQIPATVQRTTSTLIAQDVTNLPIFINSQYIAGYISVGNEIDPFGILQRAWDLKKICCLPVVTAEKFLVFIKYYPGDPLQLNRYQIPEPIFNPNNLIPITQLDLVLVPVVAFDTSHNRLGSGAGFYDRTFAKLQRKAFLLGLAYTFQKIDHIDKQWWDVTLDEIVAR